tara:strand:- start:2567 stop:2752 length:186 start_codon:yes stop_codon:yes gene_type:complete
MKKIADAFFHPVTVLNLLFVGSLGVIEFVHTKAHHTLEADVHGHVHQFLRKHPETCDYIDY